MRLILLTLMFAVLLSSSIFGGVIKSTKSTVSFEGFGKLTTKTNVKIEGLVKREDSKNSFKGKGLMGSMMSKLFFKSGHEGTILDLNNMQQIKLNHADKEYSIQPVEKPDWGKFEDSEMEDQEQETEQRDESKIRIIRTEFKVSNTDKTKEINDFNCGHYTVKFVTVWENTETGDQGTDSLFTNVWTTQETEDIKKAQKEEYEFAKKYMAKIGMEGVLGQDDIMGTRWLGMLGAMNKGRDRGADFSESKFVKEMQKMEGYAILIDGKYFAIRPKAEQEEEPEEKTDITDVKGMFGGLMSKALKKDKEKESKGPKAAFSYRTEVVKLKTGKVEPEDLKAPKNYTKVDE